MKIFLGTDFSDDRLKFTAQIGADGVSGAPEPGPGDDGFYSVETLRKHRERVESYGLEWAAVRMAPLEWTYRWMLGLPGAEEQIENFKKTIRNMADVGLVFIIFNMHALRIYRMMSYVGDLHHECHSIMPKARRRPTHSSVRRRLGCRHGRRGGR